MTTVNFLSTPTQGLYLAFKEHFDEISGLAYTLLHDTETKAELVRSLKASHELLVKTIGETDAINRDLKG